MAVFLIYGLVAFGVLLYVLAWYARSPQHSPERWAADHHLELTPRSLPYVAAYVQHGRALRQVCAVGGPFVALAFTAAFGVDLGVTGLVWMIGGYIVGCVWAELSLGRVPAGPSRIASLTPRRRADYLLPRLAQAQIAVPVAAVVSGAVLGNALDDAAPLPAEATTATATTVALTSAALVALITAATIAAQRHIVRRPQPRSESDLVAADTTMRATSVHQLAVAHVVAVILVVAGAASTLSNFATGGLQVILLLVGIAALPAAIAVWSLRNAGLHPTRVPALSETTASPVVDVVNGDVPRWTVRRHPALVAVGCIVALCAVLGVLHWWGPVNPPVSASAVGTFIQGPPFEPTPAAVNVSVRVTNNGFATTTLESMTVAGDGPFARVAVRTIKRRVDLYGGSNDALPVELPLTLEHGELAFDIELDRPDCTQDWKEAPVPLELVVKTFTGRRVDIPVRFVPSAPCHDALPTGPQPADLAGATKGVLDAFDTVYGPEGEHTKEEKGARIDDPRGVDVAGDAARNGPYGEIVKHADAHVSEISFDRPDHAWVRYNIADRGSTIGTHKGEAVLVDGVWKVTRATVCANLALANGVCPPLPPALR